MSRFLSSPLQLILPQRACSPSSSSPSSLPMLGSHRPLCNATRRLLGQRRSLPPTARVVCTSTANCRDISTKPPQKYASLAPHPVHSAASSFSPSLPYPHPPPPPAAYPSPFPQPHDVDRQPQTTAEPAGGQTFYRRELPKHLHSFTSKSGRALFKECVASGNAEIYFSLSGNFTTQSEPAFCGLGSLAMVLNALTVDPGRRWKGVWRWVMSSFESLEPHPQLCR